MPDEIPEEEQMALVNLVWEAPESDALNIGEVFEYPGVWIPKVMGFETCAEYGELTAHTYLRVVGNARVCIPWTGYDR